MATGALARHVLPYRLDTGLQTSRGSPGGLQSTERWGTFTHHRMVPELGEGISRKLYSTHFKNHVEDINCSCVSVVSAILIHFRKAWGGGGTVSIRRSRHLPGWGPCNLPLKQIMAWSSESQISPQPSTSQPKSGWSSCVLHLLCCSHGKIK